MKLRLMILAIALLVISPSPVAPSEKDIYIHVGFITGKDYLDMSDSQKNAYSMGVIDGIFLAPFFGAPKHKMIWVEGCTEGMNDVQIAVILTKYLKDNPGWWHLSANVAMRNAMKDACNYKPQEK